MRRIRSFAVVAAATSAITFAEVGTATADTTATNGGLASATFLSYGVSITCRPNVAENRYIYIRVCTYNSFINPPVCGAYKRSSTS
ncbi:Secreted protein OS=Streptomyces aurantiogriseus OX=66870 GN=GCM10010251_24940 PE=4 SV=1 [Streptomyces aurantiogriseus]|uniref:Secreted protein n=1 Tax=Streptomyces aurantiogriseus TaxID=66870 RepID=A0A918C793_9ACTN|nr:hypothetical protein GCM10010251_24940 [Streptomyces aurantiogriseus]